jgi:hypothetical protein
MNKYEMSPEELLLMTNELDDTAGYLVKASTLKYLVEKAVNADRATRPSAQPAQPPQVAAQTTAIDMVMHDQVPEEGQPSRSIPVRVESENGQVWIRPQGYGDATSMDGHGWPIGVELANNEIRVLVWADINEEDPTHKISVEGAKEDKRLYSCAGCGKEDVEVIFCESCDTWATPGTPQGSAWRPAPSTECAGTYA